MTAPLILSMQYADEDNHNHTAPNRGSRSRRYTQKSMLRLGLISLTLLLAIALFLHRESVLATFPLLNKQALQDRTLQLLTNLQASHESSRFIPLFGYAVCLMLWECIGLSTIPVETAAGMVFGWNAVWASCLGKQAGAMMAFGLGRTWLAAWAHAKFVTGGNPFLVTLLTMPAPRPTPNTGAVATRADAELANIETPNGGYAMDTRRLLKRSLSSDSTCSTASTSASSSITVAFHDDISIAPISPLATAFLMKFACFPETIKNFGSSLMTTIEPWMFFTATLVHGALFSILWTWLGVDAALRLNYDNNHDVLLTDNTRTTVTASVLSNVNVDPSEGTRRPHEGAGMATFTTGAAADGYPTDRGLQAALMIAGFVTFVVSPVLMAWWIRTVKQEAAAGTDTSCRSHNKTVAGPEFACAADRYQRTSVTVKETAGASTGADMEADDDDSNSCGGCSHAMMDLHPSPYRLSHDDEDVTQSSDDGGGGGKEVLLLLDHDQMALSSSMITMDNMAVGCNSSYTGSCSHSVNGSLSGCGGGSQSSSRKRSARHPTPYTAVAQSQSSWR